MQGHKSSNIGANQPPFLGVCRDGQRDVQRDVQRGVQACAEGCAGMCRGVGKLPQGAALISMRDYDWSNSVRTPRDVHTVTCTIAALCLHCLHSFYDYGFHISYDVFVLCNVV